MNNSSVNKVFKCSFPLGISSSLIYTLAPIFGAFSKTVAVLFFTSGSFNPSVLHWSGDYWFNKIAYFSESFTSSEKLFNLFGYFAVVKWWLNHRFKKSSGPNVNNSSSVS